MATMCSSTKSSSMAHHSSNRDTMTTCPTHAKRPVAKLSTRKCKSSLLWLQWPSSPMPLPPQPMMTLMTKRTTPAPTKMTVAPWPTCHLLAVAVQAARRCVSEPLPNTPHHKVAPLVQVMFLVTPYGTLASQDAFLISQKKAWTSKQEWLRGHQKWRAGIW